jgi:hypothetical protein
MVKSVTVLLALSICGAPAVHAYSILTHEAVVDALWDTGIQPALLKRFPSSTPDQLKEAHAYAYGGSLIQDMGYYPFSNKLFTDLTHYVRSGDFVVAMVRDSENLDEYAFALGSMAHYAADMNGHKLATNESVPLLYPKLRREFGTVVTYWDNPISHMRTEFTFDVLQVSQGHYATQSYRDFIGFQVSKPLFEHAFQDTYGLDTKDLFNNLDLALGSFRYATSSLVPALTKAAWKMRKDELIKGTPGLTRKQFLFTLNRTNYEKDFGKTYRRPGFGTRLLLVMIDILPKIGPLKVLAFPPPTAKVEDLVIASFKTTTENYRTLLNQAESGSTLKIPNGNLDTGEPVVAGQYLGADLAYDKLLDKLASHDFAGISPELKQNLLAYYVNRKSAPTNAKGKPQDDWAKTQQQLDQLRQSNPITAPSHEAKRDGRPRALQSAAYAARQAP